MGKHFSAELAIGSNSAARLCGYQIARFPPELERIGTLR